MIYPTINSLTKGKFNRYQLAIAASKCARMITDEYIAQRHEADKISTGNKEIDRANAEAIVNREYRDVKAVKKLATATCKLLFPHVTDLDALTPEDLEQYKLMYRVYCLEPAVKRRGIIRAQCHMIDKEYRAEMPEFKVE